MRAKNCWSASERKQILKRLEWAWSSTQSDCTTTGRRREKASNSYSKVLNANPLLLPPFVLEVAPTRCNDEEFMDEVDKYLLGDKQYPVRYFLSSQGFDDLSRTLAGGSGRNSEKYQCLLLALSAVKSTV